VAKLDDHPTNRIQINISIFLSQLLFQTNRYAQFTRPQKCAWKWHINVISETAHSMKVCLRKKVAT